MRPTTFALLLAATVPLTAAASPPADPRPGEAAGPCPLTAAATAIDDAALRAVLPAPATDADFHDDGAPRPEKVELGRLLFFDKALSGNENISCATCHHPDHGTSDGLALPLGEGPAGLGPARRPGGMIETAVHERVPRNSPALWNLGAREFTVMFHDGRVEVDSAGHYASGFISPAKWKLPGGLDNVLAAQAMFPVTSFTEMAGQKGENPVADARSLNNAAGPGGVWELIARRLGAIPEYVDLFRAAYPGEITTGDDVTFVHAANAVAAFEAATFRADDSPFDRYLRGDDAALTPEAKAGAALFYGKAGCAGCHAGTFQTDHAFHAIAMPQIGPGKNDGRDASYWNETGLQAFLEDFGRGRVTVRPEDRYTFRTPTLRNVELTAPYGHAGAYPTLESVVRHHLAPVDSLEHYSLADAILPDLPQAVELTASGSTLSQEWLADSRWDAYRRRDGWVQEQAELRGRIAAANELEPIELTDREIGQLLEFLRSLTDERARDLSGIVPPEVPSGHPVED
jgi:cytochrome c peroxidase